MSEQPKFIYKLEYQKEVEWIPFYVGKTSDTVEKRFQQHVKAADRGEGTDKYNFIRDVVYANDCQLRAETLHEIPIGDYWCDWENFYYIQHVRKGFQMMNMKHGDSACSDALGDDWTTQEFRTIDSVTKARIAHQEAKRVRKEWRAFHKSSKTSLEVLEKQKNQLLDHKTERCRDLNFRLALLYKKMRELNSELVKDRSLDFVDVVADNSITPEKKALHKEIDDIKFKLKQIDKKCSTDVKNVEKKIDKVVEKFVEGLKPAMKEKLVDWTHGSADHRNFVIQLISKSEDKWKQIIIAKTGKEQELA